jgi:PAS domain S-box-containing protein
MVEPGREKGGDALTGRRGTQPPALVLYGVAVAAVTCASLLIFLFRPLFGTMPASLFFLAVIVSAWYGGVRAGLLATLGATIALNYLFIPSGHPLLSQVLNDLVLLSLFAVASLAVSLLTAARRQTHIALHYTKQTLEQRVQNQTAELMQANARLQTELAARKSLEETLRTSEELYRRIIETANEGIWTVDTEGHTTFVNRHMTKMLGYSAGEMLGRSLFDFVFQEDWPLMEQYWRQWQQDLKSQEIDVRLLHKDGTVVWMLVQATPLLNAQGAFSGGLGMFTDITTRKQAEEALRESEERFRLLVESVQDYAIFLLDPSGRIITWNQGAERIKGYSVAEILGQHFSCFYPAEDQAQGKPAWELQVAAVEGRVEDEGWRVRKNGERFWANVVITALSDKRGTLRGFAKVTRDMTARRRAEEEIQRLNAELEQRVIVRTAQLQQSNEDLQQFARIAAHDLQEPLHQITNYIQLLGRRYQGQLDADADEFIGYVVAAAKRLQQLILDLLAYTEVETQPQSWATVDSEAILVGALSDLRNFIAERGATVTHDPLPTVWGDSQQLQTVFRNLLANGIKFHDTQPPLVHVTATLQGQEWVFSVRDNGIGIAPQDREQVFMVFQRLHHQELYPKPGVGLAICRRIIERHGGTIWVESALGQGATFLFTLPASQTSPPSFSAPES